MQITRNMQTVLIACAVSLTACAVGQEGPRDSGVVLRDNGVLMDRPRVQDGNVVSRETGPNCMDGDGDGFGTGPGCQGMDCDDGNASVFPGAMEVCDGLDNNCNRMVDEELG